MNFTKENVKYFDVNKIVPSKYFDSYDYELFLKFASQSELEDDYCTSKTFREIEGYKIKDLEVKVTVVEDVESKELDETANPEKINEFYKKAVRLTEETGIPHEVDHIIPISKGGKHHEDNLQIITMRENRKKHTKIIED